MYNISDKALHSGAALNDAERFLLSSFITECVTVHRTWIDVPLRVHATSGCEKVTGDRFADGPIIRRGREAPTIGE